VTKCDTNISPRRLITHLLHQMVHYRTNRQGSRHWSATIKRDNIRTTSQTKVPMKFKITSESCAMVSFLWRPWTTGKVGCSTATYLTSSGTKFGSSSIKTRHEWIYTYSTSPTTPTEGNNRDQAQDISRIRLGFVCDKARFYTCKGSFNKRVLSKHFCSDRIISGFDPTQRIQVLMLPDSTSTVTHGTTTEHFQNNSRHKTKHPKMSIEVTMP
jgi:hypothetical protein